MQNSIIWLARRRKKMTQHSPHKVCLWTNYIWIHISKMIPGPKNSSSSNGNWILMSCQPHRVTSGQSNSCHKQIHISKLFSHIYQLSVKSIYKTNHFVNIKHTNTIIRHKFQKVSPLSITPVKRAHKVRICWYRWPFCLILNWVCTEKSFQNSQTFHKPLQSGTEKQHKGMQLFRTSGKGAQPLI